MIPAPAVLRGWLARLVLAVALPAAVLTAARLLQLQSAHLPENVGALLPWLPYLLLGPGLLLALLFGRGRAFFLLLLLAGFYWVLSQPLGWRVHGARLDADALRLGLACLLPLNVAAFAWLGERGVFTRHGALRCAGVLLQIGLLAVLATSRPHLVTAPLQASPLGLPTTLVGGLLGEPAWLAIVLGAVLLLLRFVLSRESFAFDLVGVLVALGLLLRFASEPAAVALYATAAGLLVLVAIVRDSHRMAFRDELTGLPGRRALQQELPKLGSRYAIAMLDVDHFKKFNDRHGHDVGDQVLKLVAARMRAVRGGGKSYRYGGEEFTVLFPGKDVDQARPHLEQLREAIAESTFHLRGKQRPEVERRKQPRKGRPATSRGRAVSVTVSIGVAERDAHHPTPEEVMKRADQALYLAKGAGRNRVSG
ncbi:MAG: diguanylate cyclase [Gammaproteobacteria bacterium]|nr:diguanylate cyclase [Gammaproteobacteria bacterium]